MLGKQSALQQKLLPVLLLVGNQVRLAHAAEAQQAFDLEIVEEGLGPQHHVHGQRLVGGVPQIAARRQVGPNVPEQLGAGDLAILADDEVQFVVGTLDLQDQLVHHLVLARLLLHFGVHLFGTWLILSLHA